MTVKQVFYIFLQVVGMLTFVAAGVAGTLIYVGAQKKKSEAVTIEKPVYMTPESEPELKELEPVSFSKPSNAEKMSDVKRKAKSRPASKAVKPVAYAAPKKVTPVEKPKQVAQKKVAPTKKQIRRMAVNSAKPLHYGPSPETKEKVQSILQFRATDNNVPTDVQRAKFSPKIGGAGMSETELEAKKQVEKERIDAAMKQFWATGKMQKK